jgi:hypothetical protein
MWALPQVAAAQSIAGTVKDTSGSVLPGVTVEASSPVLIEKVRSAVTDERGEYRIIELIPGTYTVTFTLTGFSSLRREGIELPPSFNATVNVQLRIGAIEETVTVSGSGWDAGAATVLIFLDRSDSSDPAAALTSAPAAAGVFTTTFIVPSEAPAVYSLYACENCGNPKQRAPAGHHHRGFQ